MKRKVSQLGLISVMVTAFCVVSFQSMGSAQACRTIEPVVSSQWLSDNSAMPGLVILDVRSAEAYAVGHIPGAINEPFVVPFSAWITMRDDLLLELPDEADLFAAIGALGIDTQSKVVVVSAPNPGEPPYYGLAASTRVADTLIYAGVADVAVLDGGYPGWVADDMPISTDVPTVVPVTFDGAADTGMFVSTEYVKNKIFWSTILDARDADVYYGATIEQFANKAGHIFGAKSLPAPWLWDAEGDDVYSYKDTSLLSDMAKGVIPPFGPKSREIIVYCGVGGYASALWFALTQVLGYRNVKFYDGSAQAWVGDNEMLPFRWQ